MPVWHVEFVSSAARELKKLPTNDRRRILHYLNDRIAKDEDPRRYGHALSGPLSGLWSYRIGDYRLVVKIEDKTVTVVVLRVGNRREVYR